MFLIPNFLITQSTVSKMSRNPGTPAHNTRQAVATQMKTQQLMCSRGRTGMAMQTATKTCSCVGPCRNHRWYVHNAAPDEGHERGCSLMDAPVSCATCHWLIAKVTSMGDQWAGSKIKSNQKPKQSVRTRRKTCCDHVL
jgi:hypothetical protein